MLNKKSHSGQIKSLAREYINDFRYKYVNVLQDDSSELGLRGFSKIAELYLLACKYSF